MYHQNLYIHSQQLRVLISILWCMVYISMDCVHKTLSQTIATLEVESIKFTRVQAKAVAVEIKRGKGKSAK